MAEFMNEEIKALVNAINSITEWDENELEGAMTLIQDQVKQSYTPEIQEQSINQLVNNLENQRLSREDAQAALDAAKAVLNDVLKLDELTPKQKEAAELMLQPLYTTFDRALERYHLYNIQLPIKLEKGAMVPTYAHITDACADLYALEDTIVNAHTYGNKIRTGVSIQLPEGWVAMIFPRSSIGAKTPFRLSNSVGIIDSGYRGELGVLFDNTSDNNTTINKGDRIAQLLVMPSYRFMPKVVDSLEDSDRGEGGFGSTGT